MAKGTLSKCLLLLLTIPMAACWVLGCAHSGGSNEIEDLTAIWRREDDLQMRALRARGLTYRARYEVALDSVARRVQLNAESKPRADTQSGAASGNTYADDIIEVHWETDAIATTMRLFNRGPDTLRVAWGGIEYRWEGDLFPTALAVELPGGGRATPREVTAVAPAGSLRVVMYPAGYAGYGLGLAGMPPLVGDSRQKLTKASRQWVGRAFRLTLPLLVGETLYDYVFVFRLKNVRVELGPRPL